MVRREDVRATEKDRVVVGEGFRVGDLVRGVVVGFLFFFGFWVVYFWCLRGSEEKGVGVVFFLEKKELELIYLHRSVLVINPIITLPPPRTSSASSWRAAKPGMKWSRLVGRSLGIRLPGLRKVGRWRNRFDLIDREWRE